MKGNLGRQCDYCRFMTGSSVADEVIISEVKSVNNEDRAKACAEIETMLRAFNEYSSNEDIQFLVSCLKNIAQKYNIDVAAMFWIYHQHTLTDGK